MLKTVVFVTSILLSTPLAALNCAQFLTLSFANPHVKSFKGRERAQFLTADDRALIEALFERLDDDEHSGPAILQQTLAIYLKARLRDLPEESQNHIRRSFEKFHLSWSAEPSAVKEVTATSYETSLPQEMKSSIVAFAIIAHELEHIIQDATYYDSHNGVLQGARAIAEKNLGVYRTYLMETAAMQAEWELLSLATPTMLSRETQLFEAIHFASPDMEALVHRVIANAHLPQSDYVDSEHRAGRHSLTTLSRRSAVRWGIIGVSGGWAYFLLAMGHGLVSALF